MKTLVVSDLHGIDFRPIYELERVLHPDINKIVLLGDYFDDNDRWENNQTKIQLKIFEDIIRIKRQDPRVSVLFGNHESMYVNRQGRDNLNYTSKNKYQDEVENLIETYIKDIDFAYQGPRYLYSHQGITKTFMNTINCKTIDELNEKLHNKDYSILDCKDGIRDWWNKRMFDSNVNQFEHLCKDKWCDNQIVGHYSKYGMCLNDGILAIEDKRHGNIATIYE